MDTDDVDTVGAERLDAALDAAAPLQLVRAAAALRWKRPDLTVTLAELALDAAADAATWGAAAGWLLHGRTLIGDGREVACDLLDGIGRWGEAGTELLGGPQGRRLRVELAGPARRTGERAAARALLDADPGLDALDAELQADVLTERARCAADEEPDAADAALDAAEQAWLAVGCVPGVASVLLVRAARDRRAGRPDAAAATAVAGLARVNAGGRRAGGAVSDHLAAALTAEWIAALVDADRLDEARADALPAAHRLISTARPSRQLAGLRLAVARVAAVGEDADTVLAALEPAARDAAEADVPELESACRSMLGELHEAAGRLDAALGAVRAAMAAERCDRDRGARMRTGLAAATAMWAARPSGRDVAGHAVPGVGSEAALPPPGTDRDPGRVDHVAAIDATDVGIGFDPDGYPSAPLSESLSEPVSDPTSDPTSDRTARARARAGNGNGVTRPSRRARRLAAEAAAEQGWPDVRLPELGTPTADRPSRAPAGSSTRTTDTGRAVAVGSASLIGDALFRELIDNTGAQRAPEEKPGSVAPGPLDHPDDVADTVVFDLDPHHDSTVAVPPVRPTPADRDPAPLSPGHDPGARSGALRNGAQAGPGIAGTQPRPTGGAERRSGRARDDGRVGGDTVRAPTVGPAGPGSTAPPGPNGHRDPRSGPPTPGPAQAPTDRSGRPRATDPDGLGIGDLLAGALAEYRGI